MATGLEHWLPLNKSHLAYKSAAIAVIFSEQKLGGGWPRALAPAVQESPCLQISCDCCDISIAKNRWQVASSIGSYYAEVTLPANQLRLH